MRLNEPAPPRVDELPVVQTHGVGRLAGLAAGAPRAPVSFGPTNCSLHLAPGPFAVAGRENAGHLVAPALSGAARPASNGDEQWRLGARPPRDLLGPLETRTKSGARSGGSELARRITSDAPDLWAGPESTI